MDLVGSLIISALGGFLLAYILLIPKLNGTNRKEDDDNAKH